MGLSSLPAPSEGMLCIILVNTAFSISVFKGIVQSILHIVGISLPSSSPPAASQNPSEPLCFLISPSSSCVEESRNRMPTVRFDSVCSRKTNLDKDCSVCLTKFSLDSKINKLNCGHLFHRVCLEKWMDYLNFTCPLCRTPFMHEEEASSHVW